MEPCPNCGQPVLQMSKACRHCGNALDEETFFLNEGEMVAEIMALKKEAEEKELKHQSLQKTLKLRSVLAVLFLLSGGVLVAAGGTALLQGLGASSCILGVTVTFLAFKTRQQLAAMVESKPPGKTP
jgi:predicted ATP-dependent serine protease